MRCLRYATATAASLIASAGCGTAIRQTTTRVSTPAPPATSHSDPKRPTMHAPPTIRISRTPYGRALVDRRGFALYLFTHDRSTASRCYGACAAAWPPYVVGKRPPPTGADLIGAVRRRDGRLQVTYAGHPLYYYVGDRRPGEVLCQGVAEFGGTWYVVGADGHAIH
jgi:predicted lipoprotein with Yx(FWY)xxD motif